MAPSRNRRSHSPRSPHPSERSEKRPRLHSRSRSPHSKSKRPTTESYDHHFSSENILNGKSVPHAAEEEEEAERIARIAARAEAKAATRSNGSATNGAGGGLPTIQDLLTQKKEEVAPKIVFLTKKEREQLALQKLQAQRANGHSTVTTGPSTGSGGLNSSRRDRLSSSERGRGRTTDRGRERDRDRGRNDNSAREPDKGGRERDRQDRQAERDKEKELQALKDYYLGKKTVKRRVVKPSEKFARIFQFDWEASEDTSKDSNPLYNQRLEVTPLFGRGYRAGVDMREQRKHNRYLEALTLKRQEDERKGEEQSGLGRLDRGRKEEDRQALIEGMRKRREAEVRGLEESSIGLMGKHWRDKELREMTERDWRIFREDFDISMRGSRLSLPLRNWEEGHLPEELMKAIEQLGWTEPSPIQRAAIPVGLDRRDIIGIAETGSGKTAAFAIPMINYCLTVPKEYRQRTPDEGPLALVMAPTRELAEQIESQVSILLAGTGLKSVSGVGGKPIEDQAFAIRQGVDILIGTPGRVKDLIDSHLLVLNQCNYLILDEADRMVDMGFEEQVIAVLELMGGLLKSETEEEADVQAREAKDGNQLYRVTAMFSATMPTAVERIARTYLRHPATIKIGDQNSGKNKRIEQRVIFTTEPGKKNLVIDLINKGKSEDKYIVFVNAKRNCDILGRHLDQAGIACGILHGGKSQDQREVSLEAFRVGEFRVLVATDVAARGLDIPDVSHIVNNDMPAKIENYCHRIGRTGRAGRDGLATTLLTENDSDVFYDLKAYLESTEMRIPQELARHPAAQHAPGARNERGELMGQKKGPIFSG